MTSTRAGKSSAARPGRHPDPIGAGSPIVVSDAAIVELRDRLRRTRWPRPWPDHQGVTGADTVELRRLAQWWADGFDWQAMRAQVEGLPWRTAVIDGTPVGYLRFDAELAGSVPVVLSHGWPSSVLELTELARRLSEPSRYGRRATEALTVIVPALPGFPGSPQRPELPAALPTHELWHRLMHDHLGFASYAAHGGDLGGGVTSRLGRAHPEAVIGIHLTSIAEPLDVDPATLTVEEQVYLAEVAAWYAEEGGYEHEQRTRPGTLAHGLSDSPVGLLAWLVEKYRDWSDCSGVLARRFSDDFVLTQASLYWFTNCIHTSLRPYWEHQRGLTQPLGRVDVPTAVAVFPRDLTRPPRSWAARTYDVQRYTVMPRGGHFAAHEEPDLLATDVAEFLGSLR